MNDEKKNLKQKATLKNDEVAAMNREYFKQKKLLVYNIISSPGSGKTYLLENLAKKLGKRLFVIAGDVQTALDAERISSQGAGAIQIETGGGCHLNALMIKNTLETIDLEGVDILVIENVGNLVCPSTYDLGEDQKIAALSVTEGDEKPVKYPALFLRANLIVITKVDLLEFVNFNIERAKSDCLKMNHKALVFEVSNTKDVGIDEILSQMEADYKQKFEF